MGRNDPHTIGLTPQSRQAETIGDLRARLAMQERNGGSGGGGTALSVADASTTVKGKLKLAGDFEGTADLPYLRKGSTTDSGTLGVYDLRRFGATEGGDILAALEAAQTAMPAYGGEIHINLWRVNLSDTFTITKPIRIVGLGRGTYNRAEDLAGGAPFYNPTTIITWSGSAGGGPFFLTNGTSRPLGDVWFKNLACNGNNSAGLVFDFYRTQDGGMENIIVKSLGATGVALRLRTLLESAASADELNQPHVHNTQNCTFTHLHFDCPLPIEMIGGLGKVETTSQKWNVCLNHFEDVKLAYGYTDATGLSENTNGIDIWDGDNNTFVKLRVQHLGSGTGYGVEFHAAARSNYFFHTELEGGCRVRVPDSLSAGHLNHIEGYDRSNGEPLPTIDSGARLRWTASGHSGTGHWINAGQTSQINGATYYSLFVGGEVSGQPRPNVEIAAKTYVNDSTASFDAVGKDGATDVWGRLAARDSGDILIGAASDHPVVFQKNAAEVFRINTSNRLEWGADVTLYRSAAGTLRVERPSGGASILDVNAATGQDASLSLSENGTEQWKLRHDSADGILRIRDEPGARALAKFEPDAQVRFDATPDGTVNNAHRAIFMSASANWDGGSGDGGATSDNRDRIRAYFEPAGFANTTSGTRGDAITTAGALVGGHSAFMNTQSVTADWNGKGALIPHSVVVQSITNPAAVPNNYSECVPYVSRIEAVNSRGSYAGNFESFLKLRNTSDDADAGPARGFGQLMQIQERSTYASYNDTNIFDSSTGWLNSGARGLWMESSGSAILGTGILLRGSAASGGAGISGYKRAMVLQDTTGADIFCIDGAGRIGLGLTTDQSTTLASKLNFVAATTAAGGINFGGDTNLYRSAADTLNTDDTFISQQSIRVAAAGGVGFFSMASQTSAVAVAGTAGVARMYVRNGKLTIVYNDAGTTRYLKCDITSTGTGAWVLDTTAP